MFTKEQNDRLTQTSPGTPLGGLIRFFSGGTFPDTLSLNTSADMRLE